MSPLSLVALGTILTALGAAGPLGFFVGLSGVAILVVGVYRIRWRNDVLNWTLWGTLALLGALMGALVLLVGGAPVPFLLVLLIAVLQAAVTVGLATGVRACLLDAGVEPDDLRVSRLVVARTLVVVTFASTLISVLIHGLLFAVPEVTLLLIGLLSMVAYVWLGVLMFRLRDEPSLQAHATGTA